MLYAPNNYKPGHMDIYNGLATHGTHATAVDMKATWLAASYKWNMPAQMGAPVLADYGAPTWTLWVPSCTKYLRIRGWATGRGTLTCTLSTDSYNSVVDVHIGLSHSLNEPDDFGEFQSDFPVHVTANGTNRALELAGANYQAAPKEITFTADVAKYAEDAAAYALRVHSLTVRPMPPDEAEELP